LHAGTVSYARLDDMVFRILLPLFETGTYDDPPVPGAIAVDANAQVAQRAAEQSLVLLKNERQVLPLQSGQRIAVIGGHADKGVLSGGGSSGVTPWGGNAVSGVLPVEWPGPVVYLPSSPLQALRRALSGSTVWYDAGEQTDQAVALAAKADVAVVFVTQWMTEGFDGSLHLDGSQNQLVDAVAKANPRTVVVVESGGAILMPWADQVAGIIEAFYPGSRGGEALAAVLTGRVNPSGHLPISFPATDDQQVRPHPDLTPHDGVPSSVSYDEGAAVGYKWFDLSGIKPRFAFGHGLSYTRFEYTDLEAHAVGDSVRVSMTVRNAGDRAGEALAQVYLAAPATAGWESVKRLANFAKVSLTPGESRRISLSVDRRLLAIYNESRHEWIISPGHYRVMGGAASDDLPLQGDVELLGTVFSAQHATRQ
jgi:beta-glucosidase